MTSDFAATFAALKPVLGKYEKRLFVKSDSPSEYTMLTKSASPFPQHKGEPLYFGGVRLGKGYVSFYLMALYMCPEMQKNISPALKKRMQGKTCFNFKTQPEPELMANLKRLTADAVKLWGEKKWL